MRVCRVVLIALLAGCYQLPASDAPPCSIRCETECPSGLTCGTAGYCIGDGETCTPGGMVVDAAPDAGPDASPMSIAQITAGTGFACAITHDGELFCWGTNAHHVIDTGSTATFPIATKVTAAAALTLAQIDAGGDHLCAIDVNGALYCWGANQTLQCAGSGSADVVMPLEITVPQITKWTQVSAGQQYTCAIGDGSGSSSLLYCWGNDDNQQLGNNLPKTNYLPMPVVSMTTPITDWTTVATGQDHTCAISKGGGVYCWGRNDVGGLGPGGVIGTGVGSALAVSLPGKPTALAVSSGTTCVALAGAVNAGDVGDLECFGGNGSGQLGDPSLASVQAAGTKTATPIVSSKQTAFTALGADAGQLCGLSGSDVYCWGEVSDSNGEHSDPAYTMDATGMSQLTVGWNLGVDNTAGTDHLACALDGSSNAIKCWGNDSLGQLGLGGSGAVTTGAMSPVMF